MAYYFDEAFYVAAKLEQLANHGEKDPITGDFYTATGLYRAFAAAGMTPQEHYERHGRFEYLNPSEYFYEVSYLNNKLLQLQSTDPQSNWTLEKLNAALEAAHLSPVEHYERYGCYEKDAEGNFINPGSFDVSYYYAEKLNQCRESGETVNGKTGDAITLDDVASAFQAANLSPISHYVLYGAAEGLSIRGIIICGTGINEDGPGFIYFGDDIPSSDEAPKPIICTFGNDTPSSYSDAVVKLVGVDIAENEYGALTSDDFSGA